MSDMPERMRAWQRYPERMWAWQRYDDRDRPMGLGEWYPADAGLNGDETEYVRADIHAALTAERDALRDAHAENARILGLLENELQGRIEAGKLAAISKCANRSRAALKGSTDD